jgi:hypothetical protein
MVPVVGDVVILSVFIDVGEDEGVSFATFVKSSTLVGWATEFAWDLGFVASAVASGAGVATSFRPVGFSGSVGGSILWSLSVWPLIIFARISDVLAFVVLLTGSSIGVLSVLVRSLISTGSQLRDGGQNDQ